MNLFDNLVPPNMDTQCFTGYADDTGIYDSQTAPYENYLHSDVYNSDPYKASITVCSDPWNYYKANTVDIAPFIVGLVLAYAFITKR